MQNTLFLSFFCPKENIIQISYQKSSRAEVRSEYASEILNLFTYCKKTVFLFSFSCHCFLNSIKFHAWGIKKQFLWSIFTKSEHSMFAENTVAFSWMFFIWHRINFSTFYRLLLESSECISQCRVSFLHLCPILLW